jgi:putative CocE/NonD family hydrolase
LSENKISKPGQYSGFSKILYDGYKLTSQYVTVRDGTQIAVDIIRPTLNGKIVEEKLPVVWMHMTYNRRFSEGGLTGENYPGAAMALIKYGYVVAVADMRGSYASFGWAITPKREEWQLEAYWDAYDITEWLAARPWSDGNVGMWGCSATGHSQWQAAATQPPHLKAIMPLSAPSEYYDINGVTAVKGPNPPVYPAAKYPAQDMDAVAVDEDTTGEMLNAARDQHRWNLEFGVTPFRDSTSTWLKELIGRDVQIHLLVNTFTHFSEIQAAGIPFYQSSNWGEDYRVKSGVIIKLNSLSNPSKTILGGGNHCNWCSDFYSHPLNDFNITTEELRWFDYWLKGVQNGIMDEPPIYYYLNHAPAKDKAWRFAWQWPLPQAKSINFYLGVPSVDAMHSGVNKGTLTTTAPTVADAQDQYTVDYSVTADNRDQRGMTFTTDALTADTNVIGNPIVHLWISSTATDNDFLAFLYDVDENGNATQIPGTDDGQLRASLRVLNDSPFNISGLPYHRCFAEDYKPLTPGEPVELIFDLATLAYNFQTGHRIRLVISCVAIPRRNSPPITPVFDPAPVVTFYRDATHSSYIALPIVAPIEVIIDKIEVSGNRVQAIVAFPKTMDSRYLKDIQLHSVNAQGVPAESVLVDGDNLVVTFSNLPSGKITTIEGKFGDKYYYGDEMSFIGKFAKE